MNEGHQLTVAEQAESWQFPTPASRDYRSPNLKPYGQRGGQMKGEQLNNFIEHLLPSLDPETSGEPFLPSSPGLSPRGPGSTGSAMDFETLTYYQLAQRAWSRQGRLKSSATVNAEDESEDTSDEPSPSRDRKQRKLWAYRQRTMTWSNPQTWTRASFRRKLNQRFVESLMMWPPYWTSDQAVLGSEVTASWRSKALSHLRNLLGE